MFKTKDMKTAEEILIEFGCPSVPFDENVTMYYPAILSAMDEYANAKVEEALRWRDPKEELPDEAGCDFCRDEQGYTIGNMYVCDKCGRQVP